MDSSETLSKSEQSWNNSYLLDIPLIDKQHRRFIMLFDRLSELISQGKASNHLFEIIDELEKYTHYHFTTEEKLMSDALVVESEISSHQLQHQVFVKKVEEFKVASRYNNVVLSEQMIQFMRKWFLMHIKLTDSKYADAIKSYLNSKSE
jgi:hemerythrin